MTAIAIVLLLFLGGSLATLPIDGEVGGKCLLDQREPCSQQNSECIEGTCLCANFYRFINGSCITDDQSASLGRPCRSGGDCRGPGEFCSSFSVCMCLSTHVEVGSQCRPAVYPGQFGCEDSRQCSKGFPGAECDASRRCVCPHGMHAQQQTCVLPSALSNVVLSDGGYSSVRRSPSNFFARRRLSPPSAPSSGIAPDAVCSVDSDCAGYPLSFCDGVCRCVSGALNAGSTCISSGNALQPAGSCPAGQTYVAEAGACMTVQQPGEPCQYSQQCAASEPGAFCLRLRCECVYGMKQSGSGCTFVDNQCTKRGFIWIAELGECKEVLPPGGRGCSHSLQCTQAYAEAKCFLQTCTCPQNFPIAIDGTCGRNCSAGETYSGVTGQCLPTVKPGDQCLYSSQCHAINPGMICDRNRCRCPAGMVFSGSKCTQQCPAGFIVNSKGVCSPGCRLNQVEFEGDCLDQVSPGSLCSVNAQCMGGASCQNGACICPKAMMPRGSVCVFIESPPSGPCGDGQLCTGNSFCSNGNCTCPAGRQILNGQCVTPLTVDIGGSCVRVGVACGGGSICVAGICVCPLGMTPWQNMCVEHRTAKPGESCSRGEECVGGSVCDENSLRCECVRASQMVIGNTCQERLRSHPGYPCSNGEMCVGGSSCRNGRCSCPDDKIEVNKQCVERSTVGAGETCGNGETCGGGSECDYLQKKCICKRGQQIINHQCVEVVVVPAGDSCGAALVRCGGGAYCVRGRCECPNNMIPIAGKCVQQRQVPPGKSCSSAEVCMGRSVCRDGVCQCTSDMVLIGTNCEVRKKVRPLEPCRPTDECLGGSRCNGHNCECPAGQIVRENLCQPRLTKRPGTRCSQEDICIGQSICVQGKCQCRPGEKPVNGVCTKTPQVIPGGSCSANDECLGGSTCRGGICMCPSGQTIVAHVCKPIVRAMPGSSCSNGETCEGGSFCHQPSKICRCHPGYMIGKGRCIIERRVPTLVDPGMSCKEGETCRGGSECREGMCVCSEGLFVRNNKCLPPVAELRLRPPSERLLPCPSDDSCRLPNCFCSATGTVPPGGLEPRDVPQMVILSFDDPVTDRIINIYKSLFSGKFRNPNGCPIKGTFFVSHQFNNYDQTQWLHSRGNEIALNSITHEKLANATKERWRHEMIGLRESLRAFSYVETSSVKGVRAPHQMIGGDEQFDMMEENGLLYDNSMTAHEGPVWPQTLDYQLAWDCGEQNCPQKPHRGLWSLPLQLVSSNDGIWHSLARTAIKPYDNREMALRLLQRNFYRNYNGNRAPFILNADSEFLTYLPDNGVVHAIEDWLKEILNKTDIYVVTASQAIEWMKAPVSIEKARKFKPWNCNFRLNDHVQPCETPSICSYDSRGPSGLPHSFRVCGSCPRAYPWIEDPLGRKQLRV